VVVDALLAQGAEVLGVTAPVSAVSEVLGRPVLGDDRIITRHAPADVDLAIGVGSVSQPRLRFTLYERYRALGYRYATIVHPGAIVGREVVLEEGSQIMAGAVVQPGSRIGTNAIINTRASVDHDCQVGAHSHIAPGVTLSGGVSIGESCHVGTGATVIQGIQIGAGALIGAGAVVLADVPPGGKALGVWTRREKH
jgi:sugar O-acyltransferase (sialic acid O-acetyltransferase NeuD family)